MEESAYGNAMTEIALALAMAFFSIMVLAMISMGVPAEQAGRATTAATLTESRAEDTPASRLSPDQQDVLVVFHEGGFWDRDLNPIDPAAIRGAGRVILAVDPALPIKDALGARGRIDARDLVVAALDQRWLQALRNKTHDRK